jgi:hypothetical protein
MNDPTAPGDQGLVWPQGIPQPGFAPAQTPPAPQIPPSPYGQVDPNAFAYPSAGLGDAGWPTNAPPPLDDLDANARQALGDQNYTALSRLIASRPADPTGSPPSAPMSWGALMAQALRNLGDKSGFASPPATDPTPDLSLFVPVSRPAMLAEALRSLRDKSAINPAPAFAPSADFAAGNQGPSSTISDPGPMTIGQSPDDLDLGSYIGAMRSTAAPGPSGAATAFDTASPVGSAVLPNPPIRA